jgi:hypothetical protein
MVDQEQGCARLGMWLVTAPPQIGTLNVAFLFAFDYVISFGYALFSTLLLLLFPTSFLLFVLSVLGNYLRT